MTDNFDKYLDSKLTKSGKTKTSDSFTNLLMSKINTEFAVESELRKRDRAANYIIVFFSALICIITGLAGYFYFSAQPSQTLLVSETWNSYLEQFATFIQTFSLKSAGFIVTLSILSSLYLLADRVLINSHKKNKGL
jgi:hypothetical protein